MKSTSHSEPPKSGRRTTRADAQLRLSRYETEQSNPAEVDEFEIQEFRSIMRDDDERDFDECEDYRDGWFRDAGIPGND